MGRGPGSPRLSLAVVTQPGTAGRGPALAAFALAAGALSGCYFSELNGPDIGSLDEVDDTAFVRFRTADDYWVGLVVMTQTGGQIYCPDFESAAWIRMVMDVDTMIIQLYEDDDDQWVGRFGEEYDEDDPHFASGVIWTEKLEPEDGRDTAFSYAEGLDPCLGHRFTAVNQDGMIPYDHDVEAEFTWWSEGIDLRGIFAGSGAAGFIRAVDCGPIDVDVEIGAGMADYANGC